MTSLEFCQNVTHTPSILQNDTHLPYFLLHPLKANTARTYYKNKTRNRDSVPPLLLATTIFTALTFTEFTLPSLLLKAINHNVGNIQILSLLFFGALKKVYPNFKHMLNLKVTCLLLNIFYWFRNHWSVLF